MKRKKLLLGMGMLLSGMACSAQDAVTVTIGNEVKVYQIDDIVNMTFEGDKMKINKAGGAETDVFNLADIAEVTFDAATGIGSTAIAGGKLTISSPAGSNIIYINGYDANVKYSVAVYSISGEQVMAVAGWKGEPVDISALPKGVYVFKINNTTIKIRK